MCCRTTTMLWPTATRDRHSDPNPPSTLAMLPGQQVLLSYDLVYVVVQRLHQCAVSQLSGKLRVHGATRLCNIAFAGQQTITLFAANMAGVPQNLGRKSEIQRPAFDTFRGVHPAPIGCVTSLGPVCLTLAL